MHAPNILKLIKEAAPPFYLEARNVMSFELAAAQTALIQHKLSRPFQELMLFVGTNAIGFSNATMRVKDGELITLIESSFHDLNGSIGEIYGEAIEDFPSRACQTRIISQMDSFTDKTLKSLNQYVDFANKAFAFDSNNGKADVKKLFASFHTALTACSAKPINIRGNCTMSLVCHRLLCTSL